MLLYQKTGCSVMEQPVRATLNYTSHVRIYTCHVVILNSYFLS